MNTAMPMYRRRTANRDRAADATRHAVATAPTRRPPRILRSNFPNSQKRPRQATKPEIVMTVTACKNRGFILSPPTAPAVNSSAPSMSHAEPDASARRRGRPGAIGTVLILTQFIEVPCLIIALHSARPRPLDERVLIVLIARRTRGHMLRKSFQPAVNAPLTPGFPTAQAWIGPGLVP
jgi:hypothetical protein